MTGDPALASRDWSDGPLAGLVVSTVEDPQSGTPGPHVALAVLDGDGEPTGESLSASFSHETLFALSETLWEIHARRVPVALFAARTAWLRLLTAARPLDIRFPELEIIDPLVCDRALARERREADTLDSLATAYRVSVASPGEARSEALATAQLARSIAERFPELKALSMSEMEKQQRAWHDDFAGRTRDQATDTGWPLPNSAASTSGAHFGTRSRLGRGDAWWLVWWRTLSGREKARRVSAVIGLIVFLPGVWPLGERLDSNLWFTPIVLAAVLSPFVLWTFFLSPPTGDPRPENSWVGRSQRQRTEHNLWLMKSRQEKARAALIRMGIDIPLALLFTVSLIVALPAGLLAIVGAAYLWSRLLGVEF